MEAIKNAILSMIEASKEEMELLLSQCFQKKFKKSEILSFPNTIPNEIFFIEKGIVRVWITDKEGVEHTVHFALENQFIADYSNFMLKQPAMYSLQALEDTEITVMPRSAVEWGYKHLNQGDRLGRLIAEFYFIYQDNRIKNMYARTAKERYDTITEVFPNIHLRAPQHMIASYLGITPIHLSRLKKSDYRKS